LKAVLFVEIATRMMPEGKGRNGKMEEWEDGGNIGD
jgi:hypothetical protein